MRDLIHYWRTDYEWSRLERELENLGQYTAVVDGVTLHFLHVRSPRPDAKALLLCHGWPGSIVEFLDVARDLAEPADDHQPAFHLVIPSLPGYGFSSKPTDAGMGVERIADLLAALMTGLGYERYFAQGGDWGAVILTELAVQHPTQLVALHTTLPQVREPQWWNAEEEQRLSSQEKQWLEDSRRFASAGSAYAHQQATRPQTIGYALVDSPVGLAAWILDKFESWRDPALAPMSRDRLLDNLCLYWFSASGASAARLYWESYQRSRDLRPVLVPTAVSVFPHDIEKLPASWVRERYRNLYSWETREAGGHFPSLEVTDDYTDMVRSAFITF